MESLSKSVLQSARSRSLSKMTLYKFPIKYDVMEKKILFHVKADDAEVEHPERH